MVEYCGCLTVRHPREAMRDLFDEMSEWIAAPSIDEVSDIAFAVGRLLAGLANRVYWRVPLDSRHMAKINARMAEHGCIRSARHIANGNGCR